MVHCVAGFTLLKLRSANGTQKEHQEVARECAKIIAEVFPLAKELTK